MKTLQALTIPLSALALSATAAAPSSKFPSARSLFNGRDLTGWTKVLVGQPPGADPKGVYKVVTLDGEPVIRISGEFMGGLVSEEAFQNYHLTLEFRWGEARFAPRATAPRDSGLLYHADGAPSATTGWLESAELGILEGGETGDFWSVPGARRGARILVDVEAEDIPVPARRYPNQRLRWRPGGKRTLGTSEGILNGDDAERPRGQWNTVELFAVGQTAVHVVNGRVNLVLTNLRRAHEGRIEPLTRGRIQLQSEGAEVFFRNIRVRPIAEFPPALLRATAAAAPDTKAAAPDTNQLTEEERRAGWRLLFDGASLTGWRALDGVAPPPGWQVEGGELRLVKPSGDLMTTDAWSSFELDLEWRLPAGGNSGIFYHADPRQRPLHLHAPEYELRDNGKWLEDPFKTGGLYGLIPPSSSPVRPPDVWNRSRIVVRGNHIEHWLNGERVVQVERFSRVWENRLRGSKFARIPRFARAVRGPIVIQDHGTPLALRKVKLRPLPDPGAGGPLVAEPAALGMGGVRGTAIPSQTLRLRNASEAPVTLKAITVQQEAPMFALQPGPELPATLAPGAATELQLRFAPPADADPGLFRAHLSIEVIDGQQRADTLMMPLLGLASRDREGSAEPPLQQVAETLGHAIDVGADGLQLGTGPALLGEEVSAPRFRRAGPGPVRLRPVARYSPDERLPFGYYTAGAKGIRRVPLGVLMAGHAQELHPPTEPGANASFDPGEGPFGLYTESGTHIAWSEDEPNAAGPTRHAVRVYPLRDRLGAPVPASYLVCFEEARNGDYQDYVFVLENVVPAPARAKPRLEARADAEAIVIQRGPVELLRYHRRKPPGTALPVDSAGFIHPMSTPGGTVVTDLAPQDHEHHRGAFLGWVHVKGPVDGDFWGWGQWAPAADRRIVNTSARVLSTSREAARFVATNEWRAGETTVIRERLEAAVRVEGAATIADLTFTLVPASDLSLPRTAFGGFCLRTRKEGQADAEGTDGAIALPAPHHLRPETDWPAAPFYTYRQHLPDGRSFMATVVDHPRNPPSPWHNALGLRMLNPTITAPGEVTLRRGEPLVLRYRLVLQDGANDDLRAQRERLAARFRR